MRNGGIYVDSANQSYKDVDGVLYNKKYDDSGKISVKKKDSIDIYGSEWSDQIGRLFHGQQYVASEGCTPDLLKEVGYWSFMNCSNK